MIPSWLYVSQIYGDSGTTVITVSAGTNTDMFQRSKLIDILTDTENLSESVLINQIKQRTNYLDVEPSAITVSDIATSYTITIASDQIWNITYPNWITGPSSGNGSQNVIISVSENSGSSRNDVINITTTTSINKTVNITQIAKNYRTRFLTFDILSGGTIYWKYTKTTSNKTIQYSKDNGATWTNVTSTSGGTAIPVSTGEKVLFKGDNSSYGVSELYYNHFTDSGSSSVRYNIYGNIMSLIDSSSYSGMTALSGAFNFCGIFSYCQGLISTENLVLPVTTLTYQCYRRMFYSCTSLTTPPELPATTLDGYCYCNMFQSCSSLTTAPELPATILEEHCYDSMFSYCTSLTTAPELPATTLVDRCYQQLFRGCTSLNYIKCLATNVKIIVDATDWWVYDGVAASGTFVKKTGAEWWTDDEYTGSGIPRNWSVQEV